MIINSVLAGSSGGEDVVNALADSSLASASVGDKVILNSGYSANATITGLEYTGSNSSWPVMIFGQYIYGMAHSATSGYNTYFINDNTNTVSSVGRIYPSSGIESDSRYPYCCQHSTNYIKIINTSNTGTLYNSSNSALSIRGSFISTSSLKNYIAQHSGSYVHILKLNENGTAYTDVTTTISTSIPSEGLYATDEGVVDFYNNKFYTINDSGELVSSDLTNSSAPSVSYSYGRFQITDKFYIVGSFSNETGLNITNSMFYKLTKNGESSYTLTQQTLPMSLTTSITGAITLIGNLSGNRFYISTSTYNVNPTEGKLYVISFDGEDLSTAVIEETISTNDLSTVTTSGKQRLTMSYDGKYLMRHVAASQVYFTPELYRRTGYDGWIAATWNGMNFISGSLTGFIKKINNNNTVDVSTVLSAGD